MDVVASEECSAVEKAERIDRSRKWSSVEMDYTDNCESRDENEDEDEGEPYLQWLSKKLKSER